MAETYDKFRLYKRQGKWCVRLPDIFIDRFSVRQRIIRYKRWEDAMAYTLRQIRRYDLATRMHDL